MDTFSITFPNLNVMISVKTFDRDHLYTWSRNLSTLVCWVFTIHGMYALFSYYYNFYKSHLLVFQMQCYYFLASQYIIKNRLSTHAVMHHLNRTSENPTPIHLVHYRLQYLTMPFHMEAKEHGKCNELTCGYLSN
jgi:hypothetical protein